MSKLSQKKIDAFSQKILDDYDAHNPGTIFKDKIKIRNQRRCTEGNKVEVNR